METDILHGSDEWKAERYDRITGTDVAKILGLDSECSRMKLMRMKFTKEEPVVSAYGEKLMRLGREFEPVAREAYLEWDPDCQGRVPGLFQAKEPWLVGSPDMIDQGKKLVVEFKCHFHPSIIHSRPYESCEKIPLKHYVQVQTYMYILGWERGRLFSWTPCNGFSIFEFRFDQRLWDKIMPEVKIFEDQMTNLKRVGLESRHGQQILSWMKFPREYKQEWINKVWFSLLDNTTEIKQ